MCPIYVAGRNWRTPPGETRKYGDVIKEAGAWADIDRERLISQDVIVEKPVGEWVYYATPRWPAANGEGPDEAIRTVTDPVLLETLRGLGMCYRVDTIRTRRKRGRPKGSKNKQRPVSDDMDLRRRS